MPHLGKIYFVSCIVGSWIVSSYFNLFSNNESRLWPVLLFGIRFLGIIFLSQSASNRELSMILILIGCLLPTIVDSLYYFQYSMMLMESYKQNYRRKPSFWQYLWPFSSSKNKDSSLRAGTISSDELEKIVHDSTQKELFKLKLYLQKNPSIFTKTKEKFYENNKQREIHLLNYFMKNDYSGLPFTDKKDLNSNQNPKDDGHLGVADVVCEEDCIVYSWKFKDLHQLISHNPKLGLVFERCLSEDFNKKMSTSWEEEIKSRYKQILLGALMDGEVKKDDYLSYVYLFHCLYFLCRLMK